MDSLPFRGFDERAEVRIYYNGILPHWRQTGCTYFVTYRQADALPVAVVEEFKYERDLWLNQRSLSVERDENAFSKLTKEDRRICERFMASRLNKFLDAGHGSCVLRRPEVSAVVADSLVYFHGERVLTGDFIVMPNHVHVLLRPLFDFELEDILQAIKSYTAKKINRLLGRTGQFWMKESYDHIVREFDQLVAYQRYIKANPEKANVTMSDCRYQAARYISE